MMLATCCDSAGTAAETLAAESKSSSTRRPLTTVVFGAEMSSVPSVARRMEGAAVLPRTAVASTHSSSNISALNNSCVAR